MNYKNIFFVIFSFAILLKTTVVIAVPVITTGDNFFRADDSGEIIARGVFHYGVEIDGLIVAEFGSGFSGGLSGFDVSASSTITGPLPAYSSASNVYQNTFTITNASDIAKSFAISTYFDVDIGSPASYEQCINYIGDAVTCDMAAFNAATNSLVTTNMFDSTIFAASINTSFVDANLAYGVGSFDDADLSWYSTLTNNESSTISDLALGLGYEMFVNPGETFTITYDYLVCTDTSGDTCGLTTSVSESSSMLLLLTGFLLLLAAGASNRKKFNL